MGLHLLRSAVFSSLAICLACAGVARADGGDVAKSIEETPGQGTPVRPTKMRALFSTQMQLFIEQKEAPTASKTSLRVASAPRLSQKSKD